ncbi:hypothetical protein ACQCSU_21155 [Pseudarthrobacter sp. O4]|uniref:hypothetical protein n=1 Tax=Pseudarthrobacter sp. O4 TaxID=3418417 RepID=UPI003CE6FA53
MRELGVLVDAVSAGEVLRALAAGYAPGTAEEQIVFTADLLDREALQLVAERQIPVNAGSPQMLEQLGRVSPGHPVWLRINPGFGHGHSRKTNTGGEHSKHGIWHEHLAECLGLVDRHGLKLVGFHMHIGSGVDYAHLERYARPWFNRSSGTAVTLRQYRPEAASPFPTLRTTPLWTPSVTSKFGTRPGPTCQAGTVPGAHSKSV